MYIVKGEKMRDKVIIEHVDNGFIVEIGSFKEICCSLEEMFEKLLMHYEGRSELFHEDLYGSVIINRKDPDIDKI